MAEQVTGAQSLVSSLEAAGAEVVFGIPGGAILPAYDLVHVDFGDIAHAPPGFQPGAWPETYGLGTAKPSIANYLFYPQPTTMVATTYIATGDADTLDDDVPPEDPPSGPHHRADTDRDREDSEDMS